MQGRHKNDALLIELVIVILVFSLVAVTVVQMFVAARQKSAHSGRVERALVVAQDWTERLSGAPDPAGLLVDAGFTLSGGEDSAGGVSYVLERAGGGLVVEARLSPEYPTGSGSMFSAAVSVFGGPRAEPDDGEEAAERAPLVELPALRYTPSEEVRP